MNIIFENELGKAELSGGGENNVRITALSGLGIPNVERRTFSSYDFDGVVESGRRIPQRSIVVGGDVSGDAKAVSCLFKLLSKPCRMIINCDDFSREINVNSAKVDFERKNNVYTKFVLALACDNPFFYDAEQNQVGLYVKEKLLTNQTVLPAVFSARTSGAKIIPQGDLEIEAKYVISGKRIVGEEEGEIVISNLTDGKEFRLLYIPEDNEIITVDMYTRTISSDKVGNLIEYVSDDSFLADLVIGKDGAELSVVGSGGAGDMSAYIIYKNKYIEAVT